MPPTGRNSTDPTSPSGESMQSNADLRRAAERRAGALRSWLGPFIFAALFAVPCSMPAWAYGRLLVQYVATQSWQETPAKILSAELVVHRSRKRGSTTYEAKAEYEFVFAGVPHRGTTVSPGSSVDNIGTFHQDVYRELDQHRKSGQPIHCFVDPADPSRAVLYRAVRPELFVFFSALEMTFGLVAAVLLPGFVISGFVDEHRAGRFRRRQLVDHSDEPWLWREDWAQREIVSSNKRRAIVLAAVAAWLNAVALPLWLVIPDVLSRPFLAIAATGLIAVGLFAAATAVWAWLRIVRWVFRPSEKPVAPGGTLTGQIESGSVENRAALLRLSLRCVLVERLRQGKQQTARETVLWGETQTTSGSESARNFGGLNIAVRFAIPPDQSATDDRGGSADGRIVWRLTLNADPPAKQPLAMFEVPVFRRPGEERLAADDSTAAG